LKTVTDFISGFQRNNRWIIENYNNLKKQYNNQWIAASNNAVLDFDSDLKKLVKRLKAQYPEVYGQIAVEYITSEELEKLYESRPQS
jgi:hypothetical protein